MTGLVKPCPGCGALYRVRKDGGIRQHGDCNGWTPREHRTTPYITDTHMQARIEQARALGWSLLVTCERLGVDDETVLLVWEAQDAAVAKDGSFSVPTERESMRAARARENRATMLAQLDAEQRMVTSRARAKRETQRGDERRAYRAAWMRLRRGRRAS